MALKPRHALRTSRFLRSTNPIPTHPQRLAHLVARLYSTKKQPPQPAPPATKPPSNLPSSSPSLPTITPGSPHHSTLATFLAHATAAALSRTSNVFLGTLYEYAVLSALAPLGFALTRTGRSADHGIDLLGAWRVPCHPRPLPVLVQCKSHARALKPEHVRELEGAFRGAPAAWTGSGVLGFLVGPREATRGVREALARSALPVGFLMVDGVGNGAAGNGGGGGYGEGLGEGKVRQFLWNHEATKVGLEGLGVTLRYSETESGEVSKEVALMWNGWTITKSQEKDGEVESLAVVEEISPKKRGRPKKVAEKIVVTEEITDKSPDTEEAVKRKPGRRKKNG